MVSGVQSRNTQPTGARRSWLRISLRTCLILTTLIACVLGWIACERHQSGFERQIGKKLQEQHFYPKFLGPYDSRIAHNRNEPQGLWRDLARVALGERILSIRVGDADVKSLSLLAHLKSLEKLEVVNTSVTDLTPLNGLKNLKRLAFHGESISDLTPISGLKNLEYLGLYDTSVSDLAPLVGLSNLKRLSLHGTSVSDEQLKALQQALPSCTIDE